jgi:Flp pilus assembly protein TadG
MRKCPRSYRGRLRGSRGQSLVEFTLVIIIVLGLMMAITDFARLFFTYGSMSNSAREGARYGIIYPGRVDASDNPDPDNIRARTLAHLAQLASDSIPEVLVTYPDGCQTNGCRVQVELRSEFKTITPVLPLDVTLSSRAVMYIE